MKKIIERITNLDECEKLLNELLSNLFDEGAVDSTLLEIFTCIKIYQPHLFDKFENQILIKMGLFYKPLVITTFEDYIFKIYKEYIKENFNGEFTPVQVDIIDNIENNKVFSFSSPTSTGKSYIFRYLLNHFENDIVIIVPSRALINEYYKRITEIIQEKNTNILTFIDIINTKHSKKNIFIVTPERTKDLFLMRDRLNIDIILFDEAQLSDQNSIRGMFYDSVVRRSLKYFSDSRVVFAYPFIVNPGVQFQKNKIDIVEKKAVLYSFKNVGQIFYSYDKLDNFYIFGTEVSKTGTKIPITFDPLVEVLKNGGTALIYCAKSHIYDKRIIKKFRKYIRYCPKIVNSEALAIIDKVREFIGASEKDTGNYASLMIKWMKRGVVVHHGSLPLKVRVLIEDFTQKGYSKICFATATLEQGINMPFDLVWIEKFQPSKELDVKNLIGRAGRSTNESVFDYGQVVIKDSSRTQLSKIIHKEINLNETSQLDNLVDPNDDYREYKEAIKNGTFSEEYNLTLSEICRIENTTFESITYILNSLFYEDEIDFSRLGKEEGSRTDIINAFIGIYKKYLNRELVPGEEYVLATTIKILFWRVQGKKFNQIVNYRYAYAAQVRARKELSNVISSSENLSQNRAINSMIDNLDSQWLTMFQMIPDKNIRPLNVNYNSILKSITKAHDVDYDRVVVDTYDYIDKLIGFRLGDVYFAAFDRYSKDEKNTEILREKARKMTNYIKYGTDNPNEIWLLRYGYDFEDMDWLLPIVKSVNEEEIQFGDTSNLSIDQLRRIEMHKYN